MDELPAPAPLRVIVGSDENGALIEALSAELRLAGHEVFLVGPPANEPLEWVSVGEAVGRAVAESRADLGIACCWTGTGVAMAANKVPGVRAALCGDAPTAEGARRYNDANVLVLSMRATSEGVGREILAAFLRTAAGTEEFDRRNLAELAALDDDRGV